MEARVKQRLRGHDEKREKKKKWSKKDHMSTSTKRYIALQSARKQRQGSRENFDVTTKGGEHNESEKSKHNRKTQN